VENPRGLFAVAVRVLSEVLFFRSLFRNTLVRRKTDGMPVQGSDKWLWLGAVAFHWPLFIIVLRHLRYALEPVPGAVEALIAADDLFHIGTGPAGIYATNIVVALALAYLVTRRLVVSSVRYISLFQDYFLVLLVAAVAASGMAVRYVTGADLLTVKRYAMGLLTFSPDAGSDPGFFFSLHITLVSVLAAAIPHSKIVHALGVFLSPTRNMAGDSRRRRHVNPWNPTVKVHTYGEWEHEFRDRLEKAGYTLENSDGRKV
jgi:nitrate reductase gamma subunit